MKKIIFGMLIALFFAMSIASAQNQTVNQTATQLMKIAGYTPDSPIYGLERMWERIRLMLTFNEEAKLKLKMEFAEERLAEAEAMAQKGKPEIAEKLVNEYKNQFNKTVNEVKNKYEFCIAKQEEVCKNLPFEERCANLTEEECLNSTETICKAFAEEKCVKWENMINNALNKTLKHRYVLQWVLEKVPEQAKKGIERAINNSYKHEERLKQKLGEVNETINKVKEEKQKHFYENLTEILNESGIKSEVHVPEKVHGKPM